jgi:hypothetical protein
MALKCKIGFHSWNDCQKCSICGMIRQRNHEWYNCKCLNCSKTRHILSGSKCSKCGEFVHDIKGQGSYKTYVITNSATIKMLTNEEIISYARECYELILRAYDWGSARGFKSTWIEDCPQYERLREIGMLLNKKGGITTMRKVGEMVYPQRSGYLISHFWNGVGSWLAQSRINLIESFLKLCPDELYMII